MKNKLLFTLIISTIILNYIFPVDLEEIKREFSSLGITSNNYEQFYNKIKILYLKDKQDEMILNYYIGSCMLSNKFDEALDLIEKKIYSNNKNLKIYLIIEKFRIYCRINSLKKAEKIYNDFLLHYLTSDKENKWKIYEKIEFQEFLGKYSKAIKTIQTEYKNEYTKIGYLYFFLEDYENALNYLKNYKITKGPTRGIYNSILYFIYLSQNKKNKAIKILSDYLDSFEPNISSPFFEKNDLLYLLDKIPEDDYIKQVEEKIYIPGRSVSYYLIGMKYKFANNLTTALKYFQLALCQTDLTKFDKYLFPFITNEIRKLKNDMKNNEEKQ